MAKIGCELGRQNRLLIEQIDDRFREFMREHKEQMNAILSQTKELYNHQSKRFPPVAVWSMSVLSAIAGALLTKILSVYL